MKKRSGMSVWHAVTVTALATAMLLVSSFALLATTADAAEKPKRGGKLTVHLNRGISGFDHLKSPRGGLGRTQVLWAIHEKLFRFDPKTGKLVPGLATEKSHNDDFTAWRVKLREGVKFSNGEPLTSEAYVHHFDRLLGSKLAKRFRRALQASLERVVAIDELTMEFQFSAPAPAFDYAMASSNAWVWFLNAPGFAKKNENDPNYNSMAVGAGAYMLKEWIPSESVTLVRNPHYWNPGAQHLDEITYRVIPGPESTPYMAFLAGDLDAFGTVGEAISKARRDSKKRGFTVVEGYRETSAWVLNFNLSKPPIDDLRVRTALVQAVNREAIAQIITRGAGRVGDQVYPPESPWHCPDVKYPPYNPEEAKALLKEYGKPVTFTLVTLNNAKFRRGAEILQEMWAKVGVKVDLEVMSRGAVGFEKGLFEGTFHAWVQAGINLLHPLMGDIDLHSKDKGNIRRANSPKLDSAIDALKASAFKGEKAIYEANCELEKAKAEILPYMNVYYTLNGVFLHKHVKGVPYPTEGMKYFHEAWIDR